MITLNITATDATTIASLVNAIDKNHDVLKVVRVLPGLDGKIYALSTNRFIAVQYELSDVNLAGELPADGIGLTADACKFITANVKRVNKWNTPDRVEIVADPDTRQISIRHGQAVIGGTYPAGKYPVQLLGMVESWEALEVARPVSLGSQFLATLGKFIDGFSKVEAWTLELGAPESELAKERGRPGPIRATAGRLTALIMPRLTSN